MRVNIGSTNCLPYSFKADVNCNKQNSNFLAGSSSPKNEGLTKDEITSEKIKKSVICLSGLTLGVGALYFGVKRKIKHTKLKQMAIEFIEQRRIKYPKPNLNPEIGLDFI